MLLYMKMNPITSTQSGIYQILLCIGRYSVTCLFVWQVCSIWLHCSSYHKTKWITLDAGDLQQRGLRFAASLSKQISMCNKGPLFSQVHLTFVLKTETTLQEYCNWVKLSAVGTCLSHVCKPASTMSAFTVWCKNSQSQFVGRKETVHVEFRVVRAGDEIRTCIHKLI